MSNESLGGESGMPDNENTPFAGLTDEPRVSYLKYVTPTRATVEQQAATRARWTDERILDAIYMGI